MIDITVTVFGHSDNQCPKGGKPVLPPVLSRRVQSALSGLCCLARSEQPIHARDVASCTGIRPAEAAKILQLLAWGSFLESARGSRGGFWLSRPSSQIRVSEVVRFFDRSSDANAATPLIKALQTVTAPCCAAMEELTIEDLTRLMGFECREETLISKR
ncbi:MAG: Rrf2 family transcriptional regulator [Candidatus Koribacter versatilis]|uniref:Rrf2 family transcriptional regulator n=1 Tax=Candidatus Korobacter versatilis TaxID=658062 RepID=A0A932EP75_9BACT|nr:Rrf2 family transcriptional regulator [Candidatus Koribacter versatilis]